MVSITSLCGRCNNPVFECMCDNSTDQAYIILGSKDGEPLQRLTIRSIEHLITGNQTIIYVELNN